MSPNVLVAGVGNILLGDDGFGVEVARRLSRTPQAQTVRIADFGIRSLHLAYELLEGYDTLVLIDAMSRGDTPGTVFVVEPDLDHLEGLDEPSPDDGAHQSPMLDAHTLHPAAVLRTARALGARLATIRIVGCEPAELEPRIGLSAPVESAVDRAVVLVGELMKTLGHAAGTPANDTGATETTRGGSR